MTTNNSWCKRTRLSYFLFHAEIRFDYFGGCTTPTPVDSLSGDPLCSNIVVASMLSQPAHPWGKQMLTASLQCADNGAAPLTSVHMGVLNKAWNAESSRSVPSMFCAANFMCKSSIEKGARLRESRGPDHQNSEDQKHTAILLPYLPLCRPFHQSRKCRIYWACSQCALHFLLCLKRECSWRSEASHAQQQRGSSTIVQAQGNPSVSASSGKGSIHFQKLWDNKNQNQQSHAGHKSGLGDYGEVIELVGDW